MGLKEKILTKSLWVFHASAGSCNNCDIEILDCLTPRFDIERFGMQLIGSIRHADVLLVTGAMNKKSAPILKRLHTQAPKPCFVVAVGTCPCSQHMFKDSYNTIGPLDEIIPVDVYIPGCPPKPEAIIAGIVKLIEKLTHKK
ncbi:MAG: NADH-quinone oxidoreductase subunit NuoB [Candidatus Omnitrophota bacterium]|nr:NADH-quinone oxidoreductase subunit NuoB [Candidatus Omnitrophota bacterium]